MPADGYYSFENLDGGYDGLIRVSQDGTRFDHIKDGVWVNRQDLFNHFIDPGSDALEPIDEATAQQLAERYFATL